jgi:hypothetical protein
MRKFGASLAKWNKSVPGQSLADADAAARIIFPPLSGPSRTFVFDSEQTSRLWSVNPSFVSANPRDYTRNSRVVLYANGAFVLQYLPRSVGDSPFRGQYQDVNGVLMFLFEFQGRSVDDPWDDATGTLRGDLLTLQYAEGMHQADFEDAVYVLMP